MIDDQNDICNNVVTKQLMRRPKALNALYERKKAFCQDEMTVGDVIIRYLFTMLKLLPSLFIDFILIIVTLFNSYRFCLVF